MSDILIAIPARYGSSRLPGKILKDLNGKPVIQHVYEACKRTGLGEVIIATESPLVVEAVAKFGAKAVLTSEACQSGTDRIFEAAQNRPEEYIINVQGDEPFISTETVSAVANLLKSDPSCDISTAVFATLDDAKIDNPNCVKAVIAKDGRAERRPVTVGLWEGRDWIVLSGLKTGDAVITNQLLRLRDGARISVPDAQSTPTESSAS